MANDGWHKAWTEDLDKIVQDRAAYYKVDPNDIRRIIWHESRGNPEAKNPNSSASGLMQLLQKTFKLQNPFDPYENIDRGTKFYSEMLRQFNGDKALAARAYAWGPGWTNQWLKNGRSLDGMSKLAQSTFGTGEEFSTYMTGGKQSLPSPPISNPVQPASPIPDSSSMPIAQPLTSEQQQSPLSWNQNNWLLGQAWNMALANNQYAPEQLRIMPKLLGWTV